MRVLSLPVDATFRVDNPAKSLLTDEAVKKSNKKSSEPLMNTPLYTAAEVLTGGRAILQETVPVPKSYLTKTISYCDAPLGL